MNLVVDASMGLAWIFERQKHDEATLAEACLACLAAPEVNTIVPSLWYIEVANGLLVAERRRVVTTAKITLFRAKLAALPIRCDEAALSVKIESALALARAHQLSVYDSTYLELAMRLGAALASFDGALIAAANAVWVEVNHFARP